MFHVFSSIPWLYVVLRTILPLPWHGGIKIAVATALLGAAQFPLWSRLSSGSVFAPEYPRWLIILLNWASGGIAVLAAFQLVIDLATLVSLLFDIHDRVDWAAARYVAGALAFGLTALAVANAVRVPPRRDVTIKVANLPQRFEGYRLVQLTDLHISRLFPAHWTRSVVEETNKLGADVILITGDVIDGSVEKRKADVAPLRDLRAPDGVFLIPGNHEYLSGYDGWMAQLASLGMQVLANAHAVLLRDDERLVIAGVTDKSARRANRPEPDLSAALAGVPSGAPIILLDHEPRMAPQAASRGVALQLSGHTHGGMIVGLDRLVARANGGFVSGAYAVDGMTLYVNNGTGIWPGFALRLGRPSELTRITLRTA